MHERSAGLQFEIARLCFKLKKGLECPSTKADWNLWIRITPCYEWWSKVSWTI